MHKQSFANLLIGLSELSLLSLLLLGGLLKQTGDCAM